jgi:hypothetical protein
MSAPAATTRCNSTTPKLVCVLDGRYNEDGVGNKTKDSGIVDGTRVTMLVATGFDEDGVGNLSYYCPGDNQVEYG